LDPLPDPSEPWQPYEGLTLEKAIPIVVKMIEEQHRLIRENELRNQIRRARIMQPLLKIRGYFRQRFR